MRFSLSLFINFNLFISESNADLHFLLWRIISSHWCIRTVSMMKDKYYRSYISSFVSTGTPLVSDIQRNDSNPTVSVFFSQIVRNLTQPLLSLCNRITTHKTPCYPIAVESLETLHLSPHHYCIWLFLTVHGYWWHNLLQRTYLVTSQVWRSIRYGVTSETGFMSGKFLNFFL